MSLEAFHPVVRAFFADTYGEPTPVQRAAFSSLGAGGHGLFAAPTGSGKTLAAFLGAIDGLVRRAAAGTLTDAVDVLYISPLRALSHDIAANLEGPLADIEARLARTEPQASPIRVGVRTGDTTARDRARTTRRPPHLLVTTPESFYVLLTSEGGRALLSTVRTVIVDEIHALVGSRRGDHLALSLERLDRLTRTPVQRIGLSATQRPIETVARYLTGGAPCAVHDLGVARELDLALELPDAPLETVLANDVMDELYDRIARLAREHASTLVFVGNRRTCERAGLELGKRLGTGEVATHHGSLSRAVRLEAESKLRAGSLRALVATSSLELGIDVGDVDLVVQLGSPSSISALLQRVGRSRHQVGAVPKGRLFPLGTDDLVECIALLDSIARDELECVVPNEGALDVLAQQLVAAVSCEELTLDDAFGLVTRATPYAGLARASFDAVVTMLAEGFETERGRRSALLHLDAVHGVLRPRRGARLAALLNGGTIPDTFDYEVRLDPTGLRVGTVHEDFAIESMRGDVFQLGSTSYRIVSLEGQTMRVTDAAGEPPTLPFWVAEARSRSDALSRSVARLFDLAQAKLDAGEPLAPALARIRGVGEQAAAEAAAFLESAHAALTRLPGANVLVVERFFDEAGSAHLVVHGALGTRIHRAFALSLRKRMCRAFDVELQASAMEDAFLISLGPQHAFALEELFTWLRSTTVRDVATQAVLDRPVFETRFRWNASRALAVPRMRAGKRMPPALQRTRANDLLAVCFPDQVACLENISGPREIPDHPLVSSTLRDCLEEWMDVPGLERLLSSLERGELDVRTRELSEPSPLARRILNAKPWAFLDDAPLEERRTRAVAMRRFLDPSDAIALGALDPAAIARVRDEAFQAPRDAEELHDALLSFGPLARRDPRVLDAHVTKLLDAGRVFEVVLGASRVVVAKELEAKLGAALPHARRLDGSRLGEACDETARLALARMMLLRTGPVAARTLAELLAVDVDVAHAALVALEAEGTALRGRFEPDAPEDEWCERGLLARIHRGTLDHLRKAVEPIEPATYFEFAFAHHGLSREHRRAGEDGLLAALRLLEGFEAPASAWEDELLPGRVVDYLPGALDALGHQGRIAWLRRSPSGVERTPARLVPTAFVPVEQLDVYRVAAEPPPVGARAATVLQALGQRGPRFANELGRLCALLPAELDDALLELAARGLARSDAFAGLRAHLVGDRRGRDGRRTPLGSPGRWSAILETPRADLEHVLDTLLARYGVLFRRVLEREPHAPPFRELLPLLRRREARGELRGGRFLAGVSGEQFALDATVAALRAARRTGPHTGYVSLSAVDPLNLVGFVTHQDRVSTRPSHRLLFENGRPIGVRDTSTRPIDPSRPLSAEETRLLQLRPSPRARPGHVRGAASAVPG